MSLDRTTLRAVLPALTAVAARLFGWTLWRGQDVNWGLQNYHACDVLAVLHGRLQADAALAGPQSVLNPLPYLLPYLARRVPPPLAAGLIITASQLLPVMLPWGDRSAVGQLVRSLCLGSGRSAGGVVTVGLDTNDTRPLSELGISPDPRHLAFKLYGMTPRPAHAGGCTNPAAPAR